MQELQKQKIVLLAEPEPEARALYQRYLLGLNAVITLCDDLQVLFDHLTVTEPDLLVVNPGSNPATSLAFLERIKRSQPGLRIITVGFGTPDNYVDQFMRLGVSYHIDRRLTRPQDVAIAARQALEDFNSYLN